MMRQNIKMALSSIRQAKFRSLLTMLGIIIGVGSVVLIVSFGEGTRKQVQKQINKLGTDLITIRSGKLVDRNDKGQISNINLTAGVGSSTLTESDVNTLRRIPKISAAVPWEVITGTASVDGRPYDQGFVIATNSDMFQLLDQKLAHGDFFGPDDNMRYQAVIGAGVAKNFFGEDDPSGQTFKFRNADFYIRGVFSRFDSNPLDFGIDFNNAIFIPYGTGKLVSGGQAQVRQIYLKQQDGAVTKSTIAEVTKALKAQHQGQEDFTILSQEEYLQITSRVFGLLTSLISGIAAISLLVGGIGIMNIMLFSVSERTREIGIRKAIGATNRQILGQFLVEATVLSFTGGIIGVALAAMGTVLIRLLTDITPSITWTIVSIACGASLLVGIVFGILPALNAARKDPIESLRHE